MKYIILAAGVGTRLYPYTKNFPKCLISVSDKETVIERNIRLIMSNDNDAIITIVGGYQFEKIKSKLSNCKCEFIENPFYKITNSIASLWFAINYLNDDDDVVIINGDIVYDTLLSKEICLKPEDSVVFFDSSIKEDGDYNVQLHNGYIVVMGKELLEYDGEYAGICKIERRDMLIFKNCIDNMVKSGQYDQWYENAIVQLILNASLEIKAKDVCDYQWSEIDSINNLLKIRTIIGLE